MTVQLITGTKHYIGKSSDIKPTDSDVLTGSLFVEHDTGDVYIYDAKQWRKRTPADIAQLDSFDTLDAILKQLKIMTVHLQSLSNETVNEGDIDNDS
jgi:hypothetical protein